MWEKNPLQINFRFSAQCNTGSKYVKNQYADAHGSKSNRPCCKLLYKRFEFLQREPSTESLRRRRYEYLNIQRWIRFTVRKLSKSWMDSMPGSLWELWGNVIPGLTPFGRGRPQTHSGITRKMEFPRTHSAYYITQAIKYSVTVNYGPQTLLQPRAKQSATPSGGKRTLCQVEKFGFNQPGQRFNKPTSDTWLYKLPLKNSVKRLGERGEPDGGETKRGKCYRQAARKLWFSRLSEQ